MINIDFYGPVMFCNRSRVTSQEQQVKSEMSGETLRVTIVKGNKSRVQSQEWHVNRENIHVTFQE